LYPEDTIEKYLNMMTGWMREMGYEDGLKRKAYPPRGDHAMCTTRLAETPEDGVVDENLRVFGTDNLHVVSNSVFPNGGVVNPSLTLTAVALRFAEHLLREVV
jgi:choline dehydrogenase-like flavoprotein